MTQCPAWWLDEAAYAGPEHLDPDFVAGYDEKTGEGTELPALRAAGLLPTGTVVDLGAGTGAFALSAAPLADRVVAVDVSPAMVARLRERTASLSTVEVVHAGLLSYEHRGVRADLVHCRHALHQLPDFWKALALTRMAAILRPGGTLWLRDLVYSFEPAEAADRLDAWLAHASADAAHGWTAPELATHIRTEHSTFSWLLEPMLEHAGFAIVDRQLSSSGTYARYACRRR